MDWKSRREDGRQSPSEGASQLEQVLARASDGSGAPSSSSPSSAPPSSSDSMGSDEAIADAVIELDRMAGIGILAGGVGHEINNPLSYMLANLEFLTAEVDEIIGAIPVGARKDLDERIADIRQALADTTHGAERVRDIVQDLRTLSQDDDEIVAIDVRQVLDST